MGIQSSHHLIQLSKDVKEDLKVWQSFLSNFNGRFFFLEETWYSSSKLDLYTDASGALGFGAIFGSRWCYGKWPATWSYCNIAILEFYPIVLSLYLWGHVMRNRCILFFTDNESLVHVINKQSSKDKSLMFFKQIEKHIAGVKNRLANSVSRLQVQSFKQLAPAHMDKLPTETPCICSPRVGSHSCNTYAV